MRKFCSGLIRLLRAFPGTSTIRTAPYSCYSLVLLSFLASVLVAHAQETYSSELFQATLQYPLGWHRIEGDIEKYRGADGFFQLSALPNKETMIEEICEREATYYPLSYGTLPQLERWQVQGQDACLIWPAEDQSEDKRGQATLIARYPQPVQIRGKVHYYLILSADKYHLTEVGKTLRFTLPSVSTYTGPDVRHPKRLILKLPGREETTGPTFDPATHILEYIEQQLCFAVDVPAGWTSGGGSGGFAEFGPERGPAKFNVSNVFLGRAPTLADALAEMQRGAVNIQEVRDFDLNSRPALWITLVPVAEMRFVVLVIAPDCGYGPHSLFISALGADQEQFETFLSRIRFLRSPP